MTDAVLLCTKENGDIAHATNDQELETMNRFLNDYENKEQKLWLGLKKVKKLIFYFYLFSYMDITCLYFYESLFVK